MPYQTRKHSYRDERVAGEYDARRFDGSLGRRKHRRDCALVLGLLEGLPPGSFVLDLPCGTGRLLSALARAGYRPLGGDYAAEMMVAGAARARAECIQADAERLPLRDRSIDAAVCFRFLFHVDQPAARRRILSELARVCRGPMILQERDRASLKSRLRALRERLGLRRAGRPLPGRAELLRELEEAGLELVRIAPVSRLFSDKLLIVARSAPER